LWNVAVTTAAGIINTKTYENGSNDPKKTEKNRPSSGYAIGGFAFGGGHFKAPILTSRQRAYCYVIDRNDLQVLVCEAYKA
jgi:hypothetical protein